jgi:hypothetical protein
VAASTRTRPLINGSRRRGRVLGVFPTAVYVEISRGPRIDGDLLVVETADGLRLPRAVTLATARADAPLGVVQPGDTAQIGEGRLVVGPLALNVVRWWLPRRPRAIGNLSYDDAHLALVGGLLPPLPQPIVELLASLTTALGGRDSVEPGRAAMALVGLGDGLTPQGDDVLAGLLVGLSAMAAYRPDLRQFASTVASEAAVRTTTLSAALLRDAADGFGVPALVDFVDATLDVPPSAGDPVLAGVAGRLLAVGHSSGAGLAHGALAAARLLASSPARSEVA